jgi:hypothetical protein
MRRYLVAAALCIAAAGSTFAVPGAGSERTPDSGQAPYPARGRAIPVSSELSSLVGVEHELVFEVAKHRAPDGKRWIRLFSEYESVYRANMEDVIATLWDFEAAPKTFSRIMATRLRSDTGTTAVIEQRTGIRVLGFAYVSNLVFRDLLYRDGPGMATLEFEAIEVDETTLSSRGSWTLIEDRDESGPLTYVRYILDSCVEPKFPAQEWIMRQFGSGDIRRVLRELYRATIKRAKGG